MADPRIGYPQATTIDASSDSVPIAYDETAGSLAFSDLEGKTHIEIHNQTSSDLAVSLLAGEDGSAEAVDEMYVPAGTSNAKDNTVISTRVYIRSDSGAPIATGKVRLEVW